jgi:hypothetical protein
MGQRKEKNQTLTEGNKGNKGNEGGKAKGFSLLSWLAFV